MKNIATIEKLIIVRLLLYCKLLIQQQHSYRVDEVKKC